MQVPVLLQVSSGSSSDKINQNVNDMSSVLTLSGCMLPVRNLLDRDSIVKDLIRFVFFHRICEPLGQ